MTPAYHFLNADMTASSGNEPRWEIGETRTIAATKRIKLCAYGYHSSPTLWDALQYANGPVACLVKVGKSYASNKSPAPKNVHAKRTLIKAVNIDRELRLFAADCAEHVLCLFEREHPVDSRPRAAIDMARNFANRKATKQELATAGYAAQSAAQDAKLDATEAAKWAALAASRSAELGAELGAAAAQAAVWAARAAAGTAAGAAEINWQKEHFGQMFGDIFA